MSEAVVGLVIAYVALAVTVILLLASTKWPTWIKTALVLGVGAFYFVTYASLDRILGWPTHAALPKEFVVLSGYVKEPNTNTGEEGGIFLWVSAYDRGAQTVENEPRAYRLPYSPYLHKQVNTANKRLKRGEPQVGRVELVSGPRLEAPRTWVDERVNRVTLYDFPQRELPEK